MDVSPPLLEYPTVGNVLDRMDMPSRMVYERRSRPERSLQSAVNNEAVAMKLNPYTVCWVGVHVPRAVIRDWRPRSVWESASWDQCSELRRLRHVDRLLPDGPRNHWEGECPCSSIG